MIRPFRSEDLPELNRWLAARGHPEASLEALPRWGWFAPGVGAMFLLKAERGLAIVDDFVTCPEASPEARHAACLELVAALEETAKPGPGEPPTRLVFWTQDTSVIRRATEQHGFHQVGTFVLLTKTVE